MSAQPWGDREREPIPPKKGKQKPRCGALNKAGKRCRLNANYRRKDYRGEWIDVCKHHLNAEWLFTPDEVQ